MKNLENENKKRTAIWLYPETIEEMDKLFPTDNCKSRSEFIEKSLNFYMGYMTAEQTTDYLSKVLIGAIKGTIKEMENRLSANLFRLSVEQCTIMNMIAVEYNLSDEQLQYYRGLAIKQVKATKGKISIEDIAKFYREDE